MSYLDKKFVLSAQKIVDIETQQLQASEVYINEVTSTDVESAQEIIEQANKSKETVALDLFSLTCLARVCENMDAENLFVNLSPYTLCREDGLDELVDTLLPISEMGKQIVVEINNPPNELTSQEYIRMYPNCMKLARKGLRFATNPYYRAADVSTHLDKAFTPYLKIARPLLQKVRESEQARRALERDIKIAKIQERIIIGEGVETEDDMQTYLELECDWVQGFHIGKPKPLFVKGLGLDEDVI